MAVRKKIRSPKSDMTPGRYTEFSQMFPSEIRNYNNKKQKFLNYQG